MVPCTPTLSYKSANKFPIYLSPLAEIVATFEIAYLPLIGVEWAFNCYTTALTALSIPFLIWVGFKPDYTFLKPYSYIALAKIVAVVVPSPASSLALLATLFTRLAPILTLLSGNYIAFATVTPSLVIFGLP